MRKDYEGEELDFASQITQHAVKEASAMNLSNEDLLQIYEYMLLTRAVDDRVDLLYKQGKIEGVAFSCLGHEAIAVGAAWALGPDDVVAPLHRDLGAYLVRGITPRQVLAQFLGRRTALSRGRDGNTHGMGDLSLGVLGYVSPLPDQLPLSLGAALAFWIRQEPRVALAFFGDGSSSEGAFHETLNFASVLKAPAVFVCENNQFAYSTPTRQQFAIEDLADRAGSYGIPGVVVDGNDVLAVYEVTHEAVERARRGEGPTLIEAKTMRMRGHAAHDDASYVPQELLDEWQAKDPLSRFEATLREQEVLNDALADEIATRVAEAVDDATTFAEQSPYPEGSEALEGVFCDVNHEA